MRFFLPILLALALSGCFLDVEPVAPLGTTPRLNVYALLVAGADSQTVILSQTVPIGAFRASPELQDGTVRDAEVILAGAHSARLDKLRLVPWLTYDSTGVSRIFRDTSQLAPLRSVYTGAARFEPGERVQVEVRSPSVGAGSVSLTFPAALQPDLSDLEPALRAGRDPVIRWPAGRARATIVRFGLIGRERVYEAPADLDHVGRDTLVFLYQRRGIYELTGRDCDGQELVRAPTGCSELRLPLADLRAALAAHHRVALGFLQTATVGVFTIKQVWYEFTGWQVELFALDDSGLAAVRAGAYDPYYGGQLGDKLTVRQPARRPSTVVGADGVVGAATRTVGSLPLDPAFLP